MQQDVKEWLIKLTEDHMALSEFARNHVTSLNHKIDLVKGDIRWLKIIAAGILISIIVNLILD